MVTYFNKKDLVSFGNYMVSERRRQRFEETQRCYIVDGVKNPLPIEERLAFVYDADVCNWLDEYKNKHK